MTYRINLLEFDSPEGLGLLTPNEKLCLRNVKRTIRIYRRRGDVSLDILFLDDAGCEEQIALLKSEPSFSPSLDVDVLLAFFRSNSTPGMIKSDLCRGAALYRSGGYYLDIDVVPRVPLWDLILPEIDFVTAREAPWPPGSQGESHGGFFQAIWASKPHHEVTREYIRLYESRAKENANADEVYGTAMLTYAYNSIRSGDRSAISNAQLIDEGWLRDGEDEDVPRLRGVGCCCDAVVRVGSTVAFYSRAPGTGTSDSCFLPEHNSGTELPSWPIPVE
mmetsp:Transcript_2575/g.5455  ORF Transcript_2575/g.5455 Transcript_2575/m.5455 type:complete len:277 (+) Transcript_2575:139-969(+)